jgi:hypothetical protein
MSPDRDAGDKRSDVWALGWVLYELLTGRAIFARATTTGLRHQDINHWSIPNPIANADNKKRNGSCHHPAETVTSSPHLTKLLVAWGQGDDRALDQLIPIVRGSAHRRST